MSSEFSPTNPVKVGFIGTGSWATRVNIPGVVAHPCARAVAVCSRTPDKVQACADKFGVPHVYTDFRDLLEKEDLDAVVITTPHVDHCEQSIAALERGLHVFCEKPLGMNHEETVRMWDAAQQAGTKTMVAFTSRFIPHSIYVKDLLDEGFTGPLYHVNVIKQAGYGGKQTPLRWRWDAEKSGGGVLADLGSHAIDVGRWLAGDITRICALLPTFITERKDPATDAMRPVTVDDAVAFLAEFANGHHGVFHISWVAHRGRTQRVELCGEDGAIIFDTFAEGWANWVEVCKLGENEPQRVELPARYSEGIDTSSPEAAFHSFIENYPGPTRRFIDVIVNDEDPSPSFYDGMKCQEIIDAVKLSAAGRRWVDLPLHR